MVRSAVSPLSDGGNAAGSAARQPCRSYSQSCGSRDRLRGHRRLAGNRRVLRAETLASVIPTRARKIGGVLFNTVGIAAALAGFYCAFLSIGAFLELADLARATQSQKAGLAGPAVMIVGMLEIMIAIGLAIVTVTCLKIATLMLHPVERWRVWRTRSGQTI